MPIEAEILVEPDSLYTGGARDIVTFTAKVLNRESVLQYLWDYGDGNTGRGQQAKHTYLRSGNYKITLTVQDTENPSEQSYEFTRTITVYRRNP